MHTTLTRHASHRALAALSTSALLVTLAGAGVMAQSSPPPSQAPAPSGSPVVIGQVDHPTGATDIVLAMETGGGFVRFGFLIPQAPTFVLNGDNTVIFRPSVDPSGTGLPPFWRAVMSTEQVDALLSYALSGGHLAAARDRYDEMQVSDQADTYFTINAGGVAKRVSVYALGMQDISGPDAADLQAFNELATLLATFEQQVQKGQVLSAGLYEPTMYRGVIAESTPGEPGTVTWPWPELTIDSFQPLADNPSYLLAGLTSEQVALVTSVPSGGSYGIPIVGPDGKAYNLMLRPLLPGEPLAPAINQ
jgi:hypothetical protein